MENKDKTPKSKLQALSERIYSRVHPPKNRARRILRHERDFDVKEDIDLEVLGVKTEQEEIKDDTSVTPPLAQFYDELKEDKKVKFWTAPKIFLVFSVLFFFASMFAAYYLIMSGFNEVSAKKVKMLVKSPNYIESGDLLQLQVFIENLNHGDLEHSSLVVDYPMGTKIPNADYNIVSVGIGEKKHKVVRQRLLLGTIKSGELKKGTVRARIFGEKDKIYPIQISLEYRLKKSSAIFAVEREHKIKISSDAVAVDVYGAKEAIFGQDPELLIKVKNNSLSAMSAVVLDAQLPLGAKIISADPAPQEKYRWIFPTLKSGEEKKIKLKLKVDGQSGDERVFKFSAGVADIKAENLKPALTFKNSEYKLTVARPFLATFITAGSEKDAGYSVIKPGAELEAHLNWVNTLSKPIEDVVVIMSIDGFALNKYGVSVTKGFYKSNNNLIIWDKTTAGKKMEFMKPAANGKFKFKLATKNSSKLVKITNPSIDLTVHATAKRLSEEGVSETLDAVSKKELRVETDLRFGARSLYFENPLKSQGPLPPKVDTPTVYGVEWTVTNSTNLSKDTIVTAFLPPNVLWGKMSLPATENITYNPATGQITWNLGNVKPGTGYYLPARRVYFNLILTPSVTQLDKKATILLNQKINAIDTFTDTKIEYRINNLDTAISESEAGEAYYKVIK